jgi:aminoglycoside 6'-N-acetyltransferase I
LPNQAFEATVETLWLNADIREIHMGMKIRPVEKKDEADWLRMRIAIYGDEETVLAAEIQRFFAGHSHEPQAVLVAEEDGLLVGLAELSVHLYAEGCTSDHVGFLEGWYVEPASRRRGIGRALLTASEAWALSQGCRELATDTRLENADVVKTYEACGYEEVGQLRCFRKTLASDLNTDEA